MTPFRQTYEAIGFRQVESGDRPMIVGWLDSVRTPEDAVAFANEMLLSEEPAVITRIILYGENPIGIIGKTEIPSATLLKHNDTLVKTLLAPEYRKDDFPIAAQAKFFNTVLANIE